MPRAVLILADLYPMPGESPDLAVLPRLPTLEMLLARAHRATAPDEDWRNWLHRHLRADLQRAPDTPGYWLVTPVHCMAGLETVHLHGQGLLRLPLDEQRRLCADFEQVFAGSDWQLIATGARELLLRGPRLDADAADPARFLGRSLRDAQVQGADAATLRRLLAEVEMWLHGAAYRGMAGNGSLKVTALWPWGRPYAGPLAKRDHAYTLQRKGVVGGRLYADDLAVRACAASVGLTQSGLPDAWPDDPVADVDFYVVLNVEAGSSAAHLADIEQRWLLPALRQMQARRFRSVEMVCGARHWTVDRLAGWRFWRRRRHWFPELLAC